MSFSGPPLRCPWRCHEIGGTWIAENPSCPFHGTDPVDPEELTEEEGQRMCLEQEALNDQSLDTGED